MRRIVLVLACAVLGAALSACGTKGDLVKPDQSKPTPTPTQRDSAKSGNGS